ncbi:MAG: metal-dependent transcriptional regulator, partial [Actinomycetota bacterium]|nr:metal-dependent transcriptional regulator [Actinomycetota bacterium]
MPYQTNDYHPAFEEYCETIFELQEDGFDVIQARIVERLQVSRPGVSEMVRNMNDAGLVKMNGNSINLTS